MSQYAPRHNMPSRKPRGPYNLRREYDKEAQRRKRAETILERYGRMEGGIHLSQIRMIVTPWFIDPRDGLQTRVVRAAE